MRKLNLVVLLLISFSTAACDRTGSSTTPAQPPAVSAPSAPAAAARVTGIELGSALTDDGRVAPGAEKTTFSPSDTIYATVVTDNAPAAKLSARWTFEDGQLVNENSQTVAASDRAAATEFHIAKADGWPAGRYRVEIALDGKPAGTREFEVR